MTRAFRDWVIQYVQDARRSVDYLETRSDIDVGTLGYYGISWGSAMGPIILGLDQRFKAAVFHAGGLVEASYPAEVDPFNFAPRVSIPVLMTNGDEDFIFDLERSQKPLFDLLGSPAGQKTHSPYPGGHGVFADWGNQIVQESLDWFDRYLGPVS